MTQLLELRHQRQSYVTRGPEPYMINLRNYQIECLEAIQSNCGNGIHRQLVHLPTAAGKSVIFGSLIAKVVAATPNARVLVLAFACDLLKNAKDKILMVSPHLDVGIVDGSSKQFKSQIVISTVQTACQADALAQLQKQEFSLVICDEAHHFAAKTARLVLNTLGFLGSGSNDGQKLLCGFTATPFRQDELGLGEVFDKIVFHKSICEMIQEGFLTPPVGHKIATDLDLSKVSVGDDGDFSSMALSKVMNTDALNSLVVRSYFEKAAGQKTIAFATSIEHAVGLAKRFKEFGVAADPIHSQISAVERASLLHRYSEGDLDVLVNPMLLTEGVDLPCTSCVIITRPTQSGGLFQQMVGRGLRLFPNKRECTVLDFGDKDHRLCNVGMLLYDTNSTPKVNDTKMARLVESLPPNINRRLKSAILNVDLLGDSFTWKKDLDDGNYYLKGSRETLKIIKVGDEKYSVVLFNRDRAESIGGELDFEYAFATAEDFVNAHRQLFVVSDLNASWRELPISERQKELFRSYGFKNGIEDLSRGQASIIIGSGALRRKKQRRQYIN